jgi:bifunctional UDP-N-acetylglucosamine pyrophosphorylase/glucosamine-1-phosphate N-acetyltransferase
MRRKASIILAAGQGTRMRSPTAKVLHKVGGRTLLDRAIDAAEGLGCERIIVVAGPHSPKVAAAARQRLGPDGVALQDTPLGTADAVLAARTALGDFSGDVAITYADTPLLDAAAVAPLFEALETGDSVAVLGFEAKDPGLYGRLIRDEAGKLLKIVEAKDASADERRVTACNSGVLAASAELLFSLLDRVGDDNAKGEFYLTDVVGFAAGDGRVISLAMADEEVVQGVNTQSELATAEAQFQARTRAKLLDAGVTMTAPETVFFSYDTKIEPGVVIEPNVIFGVGVTVCAGAVIRAFSHLEGALVGEGALIGPYARLRPGAEIGAGAHIGNFVEVKNSDVGAGAKANHLAYLGDGSVGPGANIGAGVIFCNYDGFDKHRTVVGAGAFVGSNAALVAPVKIGAGAYVGSGSVITDGVEDDALALGRGRQTQKLGWAAAFRARKAQSRS